MKTALWLLVLGVTAYFGAVEIMTSRSLRAQIELQRQERAELEEQQREHARLLALQPTPEEIARLHTRSASGPNPREAATVESENLTASPPALALGEWLPHAQWTDCGRATPLATVQTMLWASAGGDTTKLQAMLQINEGDRGKLAEIFSKLPDASRAEYASPEQLLAAFTAKAMPLGNAQLVWFQQNGPDEASACVWISNPETNASSEITATPPADPKAPPQLPPSNKRSQAFLLLQRADDGWRVVVPTRAIEKLARELSR